MDFKAIEDMLGNDIPNLLVQVKQMEQKLNPFLAQINQHKDKMSPEQLAQLEKSQEQIRNYKKQINDLTI